MYNLQLYNDGSTRKNEKGDNKIGTIRSIIIDKSWGGEKGDKSWQGESE